MADASRLKGARRQGLGAPPPPEEARTDLAPPPPPRPVPVAHSGGAAPEDRTASAERREAHRGAAAELPQDGRIDGRTLRRSGRTVQFATRVSPGFDERVRRIALRDGLLLVEVLERALDAYEVSSKKEAV